MRPDQLIGLPYRLGADPKKHKAGDCLSLCRTVLTHYGISDLPFGGFGLSGIGKMHGKEGMRAFSMQKSYLSTMHLTQICMNEWRMIQLPRIIYATGKDFTNEDITSEELLKRIQVFSDEFNNIGRKLIA